jgi:hypothetical protein
MECSLHGDGYGHVTDDPRDLMYVGTLPSDGTFELDVGRDDYWHEDAAGCQDITASALWEWDG